MDLAVSHWGLSWLSGSLSILSPCVFPLLPMVLGGAVQRSRWGPLAMGMGMVLPGFVAGGSWPRHRAEQRPCSHAGCRVADVTGCADLGARPEREIHAVDDACGQRRQCFV